jgi:hypothetical protein
MRRVLVQLTVCPQCAAPAEITDRFVLGSTDGPVAHVTVSCVRRHRFTMLAERLPATTDTPRDVVPHPPPRSA